MHLIDQALLLQKNLWQLELQALPCRLEQDELNLGVESTSNAWSDRLADEVHQPKSQDLALGRRKNFSQVLLCPFSAEQQFLETSEQVYRS
jgi:hypothetical protein